MLRPRGDCVNARSRRRRPDIRGRQARPGAGNVYATNGRRGGDVARERREAHAPEERRTRLAVQIKELRSNFGPELRNIRSWRRWVTPSWGSGASLTPDFPYEDVTSTEAKRRLSNGSPPFRGLPTAEGPNPPDPSGRPSLRDRARCRRASELREFCWETAGESTPGPSPVPRVKDIARAVSRRPCNPKRFVVSGGDTVCRRRRRKSFEFRGVCMAREMRRNKSKLPAIAIFTRRTSLRARRRGELDVGATAGPRTIVPGKRARGVRVRCGAVSRASRGRAAPWRRPPGRHAR